MSRPDPDPTRTPGSRFVTLSYHADFCVVIIIFDDPVFNFIDLAELYKQSSPPSCFLFEKGNWNENP